MGALRTLAPFVVVGVIGVAAHVAIGVLPGRADARRRAEARTEAARAWKGASRCLFGDEPMEANDLATLDRLHAIALGISLDVTGSLDQKLSTSAPGWPGRCAPAVAALHAAALGDPGLAPVSDRAGILEKRLSPEYSLQEVSEAAALLWVAAKLLPDSAASIEAPPAPAPRFPLVPSPSWFFATANPIVDIQTNAFAGATAYVAAPKLGQLCTLGAKGGEALATVECTAIPKETYKVGDIADGAVPISMRMSVVTRGTMEVLKGDRKVVGVWSGASGAWAAVARDEKKGGWYVVHPTSKGIVEDKLGPCETVLDPVVVGDHVVRSCKLAEADHILAWPFPEGDASLGKPIDLGAAPVGYTEIYHRPIGCESGGLRALAFNGRVSATAQRVGSMVLRSKDGWSPMHALAAPADHVTCHGAEVVVTGVAEIDDGVWEVVQDRCTTAGCTTARVRLDDLKPRPTVKQYAVDAADLDGKLLLVYRAGAFGMRLRLAPLAEIANAPEQLVYSERYGLSPFSVRIVERPGAALVLYGGVGEGIAAMRVGPDAVLRALTISEAVR